MRNMYRSVIARPLGTAARTQLIKKRPSGNENLFELLSTPSSYTVDTQQLRREFLSWQQAVHPDSPSSGPYAAEWSQRINEAYSTLLSPLQRAQYMLSLHGSDKTVSEEDKTEDPSLLAYVLETREELDDASSKSEVDALSTQNEQQTAQTVDALGRVFGHDPVDLDEARALVVRLRYLDNIHEACRAKALAYE